MFYIFSFVKLKFAIDFWNPICQAVIYTWPFKTASTQSQGLEMDMNVNIIHSFLIWQTCGQVTRSLDIYMSSFSQWLAKGLSSNGAVILWLQLLQLISCKLFLFQQLHFITLKLYKYWAQWGTCSLWTFLFNPLGQKRKQIESNLVCFLTLLLSETE